MPRCIHLDPSGVWVFLISTRIYKAAQLMQLSTVYSHHERPDWVHLQQQAFLSYTTDHLLWCPFNDRPLIQSPTLSHSLVLWDRLKPNSRLITKYTPLAHIFHNPDFPLCMDLKAFKWWTDKGLYRIGIFFTHPQAIRLISLPFSLGDALF